MSDPAVHIPDDIQAKFPELVQLILGSESMNNEERQYWVNILPIMTPEQVQNLREILENEKRQLEAIDKKYAAQMPAAQEEKHIAETEAQRHARRTELHEKEEKHEQEEEQQAEDLLNRIENL